MTYNHLVAGGLILSVAFGIIAWLFEADYYALADILYTLAGLGFYVFGVWASVLLLRR